MLVNDDIEEFVAHGTPLPEINDDTIIKKKPQDLSVRDEKGRQRFHGAFTGGFSAGYFNTVGTKEGWTPTAFVSSRNKKADSGKQNLPEDFMDDEDFGSFGIAPKTIHTTSNFREEINSRKRKHIDDINSVIPGEAPLKGLVQPVVDSVGIKILKKLGWRRGQGIGPRVKKGEPNRAIGCSLGPLGPEAMSEEWDNVLFAPEDVDEVPYLPKDDVHGLGYTGLSNQPVLTLALPESLCGSNTKTFLAKERKKISIRGQAFGVGALEDDDEDIYSKDDMTQYDFSEFLDAKTDKPKSFRGDKTQMASLAQMLEGFCISKQPLVKKKYFPPPELPANYKPKCPFAVTVLPSGKSSNEKARGQLNPAVRSIMLGEKVFQKAATNVEPKTTGRRSRFDQAPALPIEAPHELTAPKLLTSPNLVTAPGLLATSKFKPFSKDEAKQQRYDDFIKHGCDKEYLKSIQLRSLTEWEKHQEVDEFSKTAAFFQPLPQELESRFESRSHLAVELTSNLTHVKKDTKSETETKEKKGSSKTVREIFEWHPTSALCKRFNVPNPFPDSKQDGVPQVEKKKLSLFNCISFDALSQEDSETKVISETDISESPMSVSSEVAISRVEASSSRNAEGNAQVVQEKNEAPAEKTKPPLDLFKAIFQSSASEESDSSDDEESKNPKQTELVVPSAIAAPVDNSQKKETVLSKETNNCVPVNPASSKQAFGVFANIDLDALNKRETISTHEALPINDRTELNNKTSDSEERIHNFPSQETDKQEDFYGPELPPVASCSTQLVPTPPIVGRFSKHKHKHHKHKSKKKKKKERKKSKKSKKEESSSSSVDSDEDIPSERIIQRLKKLEKLGVKHKADY